MDIKEIDKLLDMKLHESIMVEQFTKVMRVIGGWTYTEFTEHHEYTLSSCFVPEPQHLLSREKPCKIYGHRFIQVTGASIKRLHGIKLDDPNTHFICDKCGELTKSV